MFSRHAFTLFIVLLYGNCICAQDIELWLASPPKLPVHSYIMLSSMTSQILAQKNSNFIHENDLLTSLLAMRLILSNDFDYAKISKNKNQLDYKDFLTETLLSKTNIASKVDKILDLKSFAKNIGIDYPYATVRVLSRLAAELVNSYKHLGVFSELDGYFWSYVVNNNGEYSAVVYVESAISDNIIILSGASKKESLLASVQILQNYASSFYKTFDISNSINVPNKVKIFAGKTRYVEISPLLNKVIYVPSALINYKINILWKKPLMAPINEGEEIGVLKLQGRKGDVLYSVPITAAETISCASSFWYYYDCFYLFIMNLFGMEF